MNYTTRNQSFAGIELIPYLIDTANTTEPVLGRMQGFSFNETAPVIGVQELGEVGVTEFKRGPFQFAGTCQSIFYLDSNPMHPTMSKMQGDFDQNTGQIMKLKDNLTMYHVIPEWHDLAGLIVEVLEGMYFTSITHQTSPSQILIHAWSWVAKKYYTGDEWFGGNPGLSPNFPFAGSESSIQPGRRL